MAESRILGDSRGGINAEIATERDVTYKLQRVRPRIMI